MRRTLNAGEDYATGSEFRKEAQRTTWRVLEAIVRHVGESQGQESYQYLEAQFALANWLSGQRDMLFDPRPVSWSQEARDAYNDALKLIRKHFDNSPRMRVNVLRKMAAAFGQPVVTRTVDTSAGADHSAADRTGDDAYLRSVPKELERAERIVRNMGEPDPILHAAVLRDIGDWRLAGDDPEKAIEAYQEAWELLENMDDGDTVRFQLFNEPQVISEISGLMPLDPWEDSQISAFLASQMHPQMRANFLSAVRTNPNSALSVSPFDPGGQVELEFVVNERGQARNIRIVSAEPQLAGDILVRSISSATFRPRFNDGEFVPGPGRFIWQFRYDPAVAASFDLIE
jgi:hypothetical protein